MKGEHTPFQHHPRKQPALPATMQTWTHSSLRRLAVSMNMWAWTAYKIQNGGFCLYSQPLHFWLVLKRVWTLWAREFSSWVCIKDSFKALQRVYSLCVLHETIKPHYIRSSHCAFRSILSLLLALSILRRTCYPFSRLLQKSRNTTNTFPTSLLSCYPSFFNIPTAFLNLLNQNVPGLVITYHLEWEVLLLVLIYFQRTFFVFTSSCFVHVSPWLAPKLLYCFIIMV